MSAARRHSGYGPLPITFGEIETWARVFGIALDPWEYRLIRGLDDEFLAIRYSQINKGGKKAPPPEEKQQDPLKPETLLPFDRMAMLQEIQGKR